MPDERNASGIPQTYDEFASMYYERIKQQVRSFNGIDYGDVEDISHIIIMQFIESDYLNIYDHEKQSAIAQQRYENQLDQFNSGELKIRPAQLKGKFTSFLYEFVNRRLMGLRDRKNRYFMREGTSISELLDFQDSDDDHHRVPVTFVALTGVSDKEFLSIELRDVLQRCHKLLVENTTPTATRNLPELFNTMISDTFTTEESKFNKEEYAAKKGITISAVSMQQNALKSFLTTWGLHKDLQFLFIQRVRHPERRTFL